MWFLLSGFLRVGNDIVFSSVKYNTNGFYITLYNPSPMYQKHFCHWLNEALTFLVTSHLCAHDTLSDPVNACLVRKCSLLIIAYAGPVVIQCLELRPQRTLECHCGIIGGSQSVSSVPGGLPVVFQCVPVMQVTAGLPLGHHGVLAPTSVVPVASRCTCGPSGIPVCSIMQMSYWLPLEYQWVIAPASVVQW